MNILKISTLLFTLVLLSCSPSNVAFDGGGSEIAFVKISSNRITGTVSHKNRVIIVPHTYTTDSSNQSIDTISVTEDSLFYYEFPEDGIYNIIIIDKNDESGVLIDNIIISDSADTSFTSNLLPTITIDGKVETDQLSGYGDLPDIDIYIPGTPYQLKTSNNGIFRFNHIPIGKMTIESKFDIDASDVNFWPSDIITATDSYDIDYSADLVIVGDISSGNHTVSIILNLN